MTEVPRAGRRIVSDPKVMLGKPCIRGTRLTVELLLEKLAAGRTVDELLEDYPQLAHEDLQAVFAYLLESIQLEHVISR